MAKTEDHLYPVGHTSRNGGIFSILLMAYWTHEISNDYTRKMGRCFIWTAGRVMNRKEIYQLKKTWHNPHWFILVLITNLPFRNPVYSCLWGSCQSHKTSRAQFIEGVFLGSSNIKWDKNDSMHTMLRQKNHVYWRIVYICLVTSNGKLVVWGPVVWDSNRVPLSSNPFQKGILINGIKTSIKWPYKFVTGVFPPL